MKDPVRQPEIEREFAAGLWDLRFELKVSQAELAGKLSAAGRKWCPASITHLESGRNRITLADAMLIADLLGMTVDQIIRRGQCRRKVLAAASGRWPA